MRIVNRGPTRPRCGLTPVNVAEHIRAACIAEVTAFKPGNVSILSDGHGMCANDFISSAEAIALPITAPTGQVGRRILDAVVATRHAVGCNTNLGIILLAAPLIHAALEHAAEAILRPRLARVLHSLDVQDAVLAFLAIRIAAPGGLGDAARHDVKSEPGVTLLQAMSEAQDRDRIAFQYASDYEDVFEFGAVRFREAEARFGRGWAWISTYLGFLGRFSDTHIVRKFGPEVAAYIVKEARSLDQLFLDSRDPESLWPSLQKMDRTLKEAGVNPGTSADLTVASALVTVFEDALTDCFDERD